VLSGSILCNFAQDIRILHTPHKNLLLPINSFLSNVPYSYKRWGGNIKANLPKRQLHISAACYVSINGSLDNES
jgi:hypothetical protein